MWPVSLLNDDVTSVAVVLHALVTVCGMTLEHATVIARHTDEHGGVLVATMPDREAAEAMVVRLQRYGIHAAVTA